MKIEDSEKIIATWGIGIIVTLATISSLYFKGFRGDTILDAISAIGQATIPIVATLAAVSIITHNMDKKDKLGKAGKDAARRLQEKHPAILSGPKPNRSKNDTEEADETRYYLFFQKNNKGQRAQLMPIRPFKDATIEIRVPMTTMLLLGCKREGLEAQQTVLQGKVAASVRSCLEQKKPGVFTIEEPENTDIAIVIDFDEDKISPKQFGQIVESCGETAFNTIVNATREMVRQGVVS